MPDDEYITQHIVCGFGHLDKLGTLKIRNEYQWWNAITRAIHYCDNRLDEEYDRIKKYHKDYKTENQIPKKLIFCLNKVLDDWIDGGTTKYFIVVSF